MSIISDLINGGVGGILKGTGDIIDKFVTDPDKKLEAQREVERLKFEGDKLEHEVEMAGFKDRASARELGKADPWTPRILTILFVVGYFGVTIFMFLMMKGIIKDGTTMDNFTVAFISSIFGSFNTFVGMILAYYFGASKGGDDNSSAIADSFKKSMENKKK